MTYVNYKSSSPYAATPQSNDYIGRYVHRGIPSSPDDAVVKIEAKHNLRPDLLSYELYGDPSYWWVFMVRNLNDIRDPIWDFTAGKLIVVPSATYLKSIIG